jgi:uncharacterized protein
MAKLECEKYRFYWHGGEPLLAKLPFFEKIISLQKEFGYNVPVVNHVQTNGTLINDSWIDFFLESKFKIGLSIDGPAEMHDMFRKNNRKQGTHDLIMKNARKMLSRGLKFGLICTITSQSADKAKEIWDFFLSEGINSLGFNFCYSPGDYYSVSPEEHEKFIIDIFDLWIKENNKNIRVREIDNIVSPLLGKPHQGCNFSGSCARFYIC